MLKKTRFRVYFCVAVVAVTAAVGLELWNSTPEPSYRGQGLRHWLALGPSGFDDGADEFLQRNNTLVTSYLLASLRKGDNPFWKHYTWLRVHVPAVVSQRMPSWLEPKLVRLGATYWLAQLGPHGAIALVDLRKTGLRDPSPEVRRGALWALGRIDSSSKETVALIQTILDKDNDSGVRREGVGVLEMWAPGDPTVISSLIARLSDSDAQVRQISAAALGKYGARADAALGPLKHLIDIDDLAADYAARAVQQISKGVPSL